MMHNTITVAVDPGKHHAGWSIFVNGGLTKAGVTWYKPEPNKHGPEYRNPRYRQGESQTAARVAEAIAGEVECVRYAITSLAPANDRQAVRIEYVAEIPHVYVDDDRQLKKGSNPVALFPLALMSGTIAGALTSSHAFVRVRYVEPSEWKGQRSDAATWAWLRKSMSPHEVDVARACKIYDESNGKTFHHGLEAYGIGAWSLYRI